MSKRMQIILLAVLALCLATSALILVACDNNRHTHKFGQWVETPPTCETAGEKTRTCTQCDYVETVTIDPLTHDWNIIEIEGATCQHGGEYSYTCKRTGCDATKTVTTDAVDHKWDSGVAVPADCEHEGSVTYTCEYGCGTPRVDTTKALGHLWSDDYVVDTQPTFEKEGEKSKHCLRSGCYERDDIQSIPKLDSSVEIEYKVTITDPCGDAYKGVATIDFYADGKSVKQVQMTAGGVTTVTLGANNYQVKLSGLTAGYSTAEEQYDIFADSPQLTVYLNAALITSTLGGTKYEIGSILYDYLLIYYDDPDGGTKSTYFSDILANKKGILLNFYFRGCQPCANEMPALVSVAKTYMDDVQVIMVNECIRNTSDDDVTYFQRTYAGNSPLWFVNITRSRFLYNYFGNMIGGFPTTILIDCNGQIVFAHSNAMTVSSFTSVIQTYILNRYDKLHPSTKTSQITVEKCEAILPSNKFYLFNF